MERVSLCDSTPRPSIRRDNNNNFLQANHQETASSAHDSNIFHQISYLHVNFVYFIAFAVICSSAYVSLTTTNPSVLPTAGIYMLFLTFIRAYTLIICVWI